MSLLEVVDLRKSIDGTEILRGIDLSIIKGDVAAVLGPSGSGKTTLLKCLNYLEKADSGYMKFEGETFGMNRITREQIAFVRRKTAFVFQNYNLFLNKTVLANVTLGLTAGLKMKKDAAVKTAMEALDIVGMADRADSYPNQLSGGQQQRVAIARGLASDPEIIFFDEPTSALDPELIGEVLAVIKKLADEGRTMIVVTHEMDFAKNVSNRVIFMDEGRIIEEAVSEKFFANPKEQRSRDFINSILAK